MALKLITAADDYPVTLEDVKAHLRIDHSDEDDLINIYIAAAVSHVDGKYGVLQRALKPQTWELTYDSFPCFGIGFEIPLPPLISIESLKYDDADGEEQTIDAANYYVDDESVPGWLIPVYNYTWPTPLIGANVVRIRFVAGYADADSPSGSSAGVVTTVPDAIKAALLLLIADFYDHRESVGPNALGAVPVPATVSALLAPYRIHALA